MLVLEQLVVSLGDESVRCFPSFSAARNTTMLRAVLSKYDTVLCEILLESVRLDNRGTAGAGLDGCVLSPPKIL